MNSEYNRLRTFFTVKNINTVAKNFIIKRGFYLETNLNKLRCYKCREVYQLKVEESSHVDKIGSHQCNQLIETYAPNVKVPSPYSDNSLTNYTNDLNYDEFRYATFARWNMSLQIKSTVLELVEAGFYYAARPNILKCFYCKTVIDANRPNWTLSVHKKNKICERKKLALQVRASNSSRVLRQKVQADIETTPQLEAGTSTNCDNCNITASISSHQRAFEEYTVHNANTKAIYEKTLTLGFERKFVDDIIKKHLYFGKTFELLEDLIEACLTFSTNNEIARELASKAQGKEREWERELECKICMDNKVCMIFKPCNHAVSCSTCGPLLNTCPICCQRIEEISNIYF